MSRMNILIEAYSNIQALPEQIRTTASMVPVIECQGHYVTETNYIVPFMRENGIDTVEEALDRIAEANYMPKKSVGLVIASQDGINSLSEATITETTEAKLESFLRMADRLLEGGYPVFKKLSEGAHGEDCTCAECKAKRECGDNCAPKDECGGSCKKESSDEDDFDKEECGDTGDGNDGSMSAGSFNGMM